MKDELFELDEREYSVIRIQSESQLKNLEGFLEENSFKIEIKNDEVIYGLFNEGDLEVVAVFKLLEDDSNYEWKLEEFLARSNNSKNFLKIFRKFVGDENPLTVRCDDFYGFKSDEEFLETGFHFSERGREAIWIKTDNEEVLSSDSGYIYRTDCSCGFVYTGMSERTDSDSVKSYMGSGFRWKSHLKKNEDHSQVKTVLKAFQDPAELRKSEIRLISIFKNVFKSDCLNLKITEQGIPCDECEQFGRHKNTCSKFKSPESKTNDCSECGGISGHHRKICSFYSKKNILVCEYCGRNRPYHKSDCPTRRSCEECGSFNFGSHKKKCSQYVDCLPRCSLCGNPHMNHKVDCPERIERKCSECGTQSIHKKNCSHYKGRKSCEECGSAGSLHKKNCSSYKEKRKCSECGAGLGPHRSFCSKFKASPQCDECGGRKHRKTCSQYKPKKRCEECDGGSGRHRKICSKYVPIPRCAECGGVPGGHRKECSHYNKKGSCSECGGIANHHRTGCSLKRVKRCEECGASAAHKKKCSKYKTPKICDECGKIYGPHKKECSLSTKSR